MILAIHRDGIFKLFEESQICNRKKQVGRLYYVRNERNEITKHKHDKPDKIPGRTDLTLFVPQSQKKTEFQNAIFPSLSIEYIEVHTSDILNQMTR